MKNYEGVFIISPDLTNDAAKSLVAGLQDLITKNGGRVDGLQEWGKKRLAYKIKRKQEGNYVVLNFQLDTQHTKKVEQAARLNDNVLRHLLVSKDEK